MSSTDHQYNQWHSGQTTTDDLNTRWHRFVLSQLSSHALTGKRILEIGCGRGGLSKHIVSLSPGIKNIMACDYSEAAIAIARGKHTHKSISWKKEDIMSLSFNENEFDLAISCETIEHVPDSSRAIRELFRVLRPGGQLILTCPNYFNLFGIWCLYRWFIGKPFTEGGQPYVNYLLMPVVYRWIVLAGFKVEHFEAAEIVVPARVPKHFYDNNTPKWMRPFGYRTFYILRKPLR